jgi:hypothetical protein
VRYDQLHGAASTGMQQDNREFSLGGVLVFKLVELDADWVIVSGLTLDFPGRQKKAHSYA